MAEPTPAPTKGPEIPVTTEDIRALLNRTRAGDESTVPLVRKMLNDPAGLRMFGGDLAAEVISSFARAMASKDVGFREAILKKAELMRADLFGDSPTPVERVLVERVVACWLQTQDAELRASQGYANATIKQAEFHQRRVDATHRRLLAAVKTLALVRKLALPTLQINVAKRQVNVAAAAVVTAP